MKYNPDKHHRRSIRLKGYDYSSAGAYFITICVYQRECLLGKIVDGVPVWQRNYYEHIVRNEKSLHDIRQYIQHNPISWQQDQLYPDNPAKW